MTKNRWFSWNWVWLKGRKNTSFPKTIKSFSNILSFLSPTPRIQSQKSTLAPTLQPLPWTTSKMYGSRRSGPRQHYEIVWVWVWVFCYYLCFFTQTLPFSLLRVAFLILHFFPQSTVLGVIPWSIGVESCPRRMGKLHGVSFLTLTMAFSLWVKWKLQGALKGKIRGKKNAEVRRHEFQSLTLFYLLAVNHLGKSFHLPVTYFWKWQ